MAELRLTQGFAAIIDDEDLPGLRHSHWHFKEGYAVRSIKLGDLFKHQYLHHAIMQPPPGHQVRFKDGNGLNCRKSNLLIVTVQDSRRAARPRQNTSSPYKGVRFNKKAGKFVAAIRLNGKERYLGLFTDEMQAAKAYDAAARDLFGPVAYLNFPDP